MGRATRKLPSQGSQVQIVRLCEAYFASSMLLGMMGGAKAYNPSVRRFHARSAVGPKPDMGALNGQLCASRDATMMPPYPGAMGRASTPTSCRARPVLLRWEPKHAQSPPLWFSSRH